jgi:hypothetical protein
LNVLYLHGWHSKVGGVKPTFLEGRGFNVINPALDDEDFAAALASAQAEYDAGRPFVVVGSSRGGAVAMNLRATGAPLVLLCPAWKRWGTARVVPPGTVLLHSERDDVIPIADSRELLRNSRLPETSLIVVGNDHRLADPEPLAAMLTAVRAADAKG